MRAMIAIAVALACGLGACTGFQDAGMRADRVVAQIAAEAGKGLE